ncbi:hypothetical protein TSAR_014112 [Trichomalopsis sarcophagae]|uniref:Uncharacterized protein n=1 Tax=Trichomalopsis sarcophagae TaxID=543379 RepID=A0A232EY79_9HYME|nr:hypothetical protein TSAR_014112 [Trichomalopsis sarcophagae]
MAGCCKAFNKAIALVEKRISGLECSLSVQEGLSDQLLGTTTVRKCLIILYYHKVEAPIPLRNERGARVSGCGRGRGRNRVGGRGLFRTDAIEAAPNPLNVLRDEEDSPAETMEANVEVAAAKEALPVEEGQLRPRIGGREGERGRGRGRGHRRGHGRGRGRVRGRGREEGRRTEGIDAVEAVPPIAADHPLENY